MKEGAPSSFFLPTISAFEAILKADAIVAAQSDNNLNISKENYNQLTEYAAVVARRGRYTQKEEYFDLINDARKKTSSEECRNCYGWVLLQFVEWSKTESLTARFKLIAAQECAETPPPLCLR